MNICKKLFEEYKQKRKELKPYLYDIFTYCDYRNKLLFDIFNKLNFRELYQLTRLSKLEQEEFRRYFGISGCIILLDVIRFRKQND